MNKIKLEEPVMITDLALFNNDNLIEAKKILEAFNGDRKYLAGEGFYLYVNRISNKVFISNDDGDCYAVNSKGILEQYICLPISDDEGFLSDLLKNYRKYCATDREQLKFCKQLIN